MRAMKNALPKVIQKLIDEFARLPGIGPKSAQRLAIHLLHSPDSKRHGLSDAITNMKNGVDFCRRCWHLADQNPCSMCCDTQRDQSMVCVVEQILDVAALEQSGTYHGVYHVLHGVLSPIHGVGPEQLKLLELAERVKAGDVNEIILATNPSLEGEATALYIIRMLKTYPHVKITRIARGLPMGGELGYADQVTLTRAMEGRREMQD